MPPVETTRKRELLGFQAMRDAAVVLVVLVLFGSVRFAGPAPDVADGGLVPAAVASEPAPDEVRPAAGSDSEAADDGDTCDRPETAVLRTRLALPVARMEATVDRQTVSLVVIRDDEVIRELELNLDEIPAAAREAGRVWIERAAERAEKARVSS
jgi:hypothetical protein